MLIGIDASKAASKQKTGVENLVYQLILNLQEIDKSNNYLLFTPFPLDKELRKNPNFKEKVIPFVRFWNKVRLPLELLNSKLDVFLMPGYMIPSFSPKNTAVIIHDLAYKYFPEAYPKSELLLQEMAAKRAAKRAQRIIFPSKSTRNDFLKFHKYPQKKTVVIPLGYNRTIISAKNENDKLGYDFPYILFVSRLETRKNVSTLVKAFKLFKEKGKTRHKLVLAGKPGYGYDSIIHTINSLGETSKDIFMPGFVSDKDIPSLFANADAFCLVSLYEGFGMPVLEAFAAGVPVVTSNTSSLSEISGNAAIKVNPNDELQIADAMYKCVFDKTLRRTLINEGLNQIQQYSWHNFAKHVLATLETMNK